MVMWKSKGSYIDDHTHLDTHYTAYSRSVFASSCTLLHIFTINDKSLDGDSIDASSSKCLWDAGLTRSSCSLFYMWFSYIIHIYLIRVTHPWRPIIAKLALDSAGFRTPSVESHSGSKVFSDSQPQRQTLWANLHTIHLLLMSPIFPLFFFFDGTRKWLPRRRHTIPYRIVRCLQNDRSFALFLHRLSGVCPPLTFASTLCCCLHRTQCCCIFFLPFFIQSLLLCVCVCVCVCDSAHDRYH